MSSITINFPTEKWLATEAIATLLAHCKSLECLRVDRMDCLFTKATENCPSSAVDAELVAQQPMASSPLFVPAVPSTLKCLQIFKGLVAWEDDPEVEAVGLPLLLQKCPQIRFFLSAFSSAFSPSEIMVGKLLRFAAGKEAI